MSFKAQALAMVGPKPPGEPGQLEANAPLLG